MKRGTLIGVQAAHLLATAGHEAMPMELAGGLIVIDEASDMPLDFDAVPRKLSNDPLHADFRPDFMRVGVRIDGQERMNIAWYDADRLVWKSISGTTYSAESIEPFWRSPATRQDRRLLKRWFDKKRQK